MDCAGKYKKNIRVVGCQKTLPHSPKSLRSVSKMSGRLAVHWQFLAHLSLVGSPELCSNNILTVKYFIDKNANSAFRDFHGTPVLSIDEVIERADSLPIVIGIFNSKEVERVYKNLAELGLNVIEADPYALLFSYFTGVASRGRIQKNLLSSLSASEGFMRSANIRMAKYLRIFSCHPLSLGM